MSDQRLWKIIIYKCFLSSRTSTGKRYGSRLGYWLPKMSCLAECRQFHIGKRLSKASALDQNDFWLPEIEGVILKGQSLSQSLDTSRHSKSSLTTKDKYPLQLKKQKHHYWWDLISHSQTTTGIKQSPYGPHRALNLKLKCKELWFKYPFLSLALLPSQYIFIEICISKWNIQRFHP